MNATEKTRFRDLIRQKLAEIDREDGLGQDGQSVVTLDQQAVGRLSRMDALQAQAMAKAQQVRRDAKRLALQSALERIGTDEFGWCEDCGEEIAVKRLEFDPSVTRCIACAAG
nr:TraR/DksA C4-type zinc finger protein [Shimia biformata]